jgi:lysophospholipase L1-like esterase
MIPLANNEIVRALAVLIALLTLKAVQAAGLAPHEAKTLMSTLSSRELNKEAREALTAGYYEGLINEGARVSSMNRLVTGSRRITFEDRSQPDRRETHDFRFYELIPNSDIPDYRDGRQRYRLKTNSAGFADREYSLEKPAGVRRLAIMGDSITRGQGAPFQGTYEALLEARLNDDTHNAPAVEILNFAVGSYNVTQSMETAKVKASQFHPDVYVFPLSKLSVYRSWAQHIALLMNAGVDLKYDYLRGMVRDAGVWADDPINVFQAKIARFRLPTIKWTLTQVQAQAAADRAAMVVLLIPTVEELSVLEEEFLGVREILNQLRIPYIDLLDTFQDVDLSIYRVAHNDAHPNAEGHKRLYENLYRRLQERPGLMRLVIGDITPPSPVSRISPAASSDPRN